MTGEGSDGDRVMTTTEPGRGTERERALEAEVAHWRARFEAERERLAKLWLAYVDVEEELARRRARDGRDDEEGPPAGRTGGG